MKKFNLYFYGLLLFSSTIVGQRAPRPSSPEVNKDKTITFNYFAPNAQKVEVSGEFMPDRMEMKKDDSGIWSVTTSPVIPDIYPYSFFVDGVQIADPNNTHIFANERFKRSIVDVPGESPLIHSLRNVPHGKIHYQYYNSSSLNTTRRLLVYTPPGYEANGSKKYPVLYLIHGGSDTEETWTKVGNANFIADNLIAEGSSTPMIIVMPYGNVRPSPMEDFTKDVIEDIIPFIESNYAVVADKDHRAVAGFSVGGGQTLNIGIMHPETFSYVCSYAPFTNTPEFKANFSDWNPDAKKLNQAFKLFTISVGTEDFLYESVKQNIAMFEEKGVNLKPYIVSGGHTWMNCKLFLATTLQEIFK